MAQQTTQQYTVDYFINKFEAIPEEEWMTQRYNDDLGRRCAYGHCGKRENDSSALSDEGYALKQLFEDHRLGVIDTNDGLQSGYCGSRAPTAKQRIIETLKKMKEKQNGQA